MNLMLGQWTTEEIEWIGDAVGEVLVDFRGFCRVLVSDLLAPPTCDVDPCSITARALLVGATSNTIFDLIVTLLSRHSHRRDHLEVLGEYLRWVNTVAEDAMLGRA